MKDYPAAEFGVPLVPVELLKITRIEPHQDQEDQEQRTLEDYLGLHQYKGVLLVQDGSLLCYTNQNIFMVSRNTRHFSSGISNAI